MWLFEIEKFFFNPSSNLWENAARSSGVLNLEYCNRSGGGLSDLSVNGTSEHTFDLIRRSHCNELSTLDQAWNGCYQTGKLAIVTVRLTLGCIQLFDP